MKPSKPTSSAMQMSIQALLMTRPAPKGIKKLSKDYKNPLSKAMKFAQSLGEIIYKKPIVHSLDKDDGLSASLDAAKRDQFFHDEATNESYTYSEMLENAHQIQGPEMRLKAYMGIVNEVNEETHFDELIEAAKKHRDASAMQEFFKLIATHKKMNTYRAIKAAKEITDPDEQQSILQTFLQTLHESSKRYPPAPSIFLEIAKLTSNADLREQILCEAIAPKSSYQYEFEAQLQAYALLRHKSQPPRTRLQIIEDFFSPDFTHILSASANGEKTKFAWLNDDLFKSLEPAELDLVLPGLAHSIPGINKMDQKRQRECVNDIVKKITRFFNDPGVLASFMAALVLNSKINFIALQTVVRNYFKGKSFDDLLTCFKCLTKQASPMENYKPYGLMWLRFCRSRPEATQSATLFQGTTSHIMGQPNNGWHIVNEKLPDAADIKNLMSSEDLECLACNTAIDQEARKYLIRIMHKKDENKEVGRHFLTIVESNQDSLRFSKVKPIDQDESMEG